MAKPEVNYTIRHNVCSECPFRRKSAAGWLGENSPERLIAAATSDNSIGCHRNANALLDHNTYSTWERADMAAPRCRGAAIFMRNICKMPRSRKYASKLRSVKSDKSRVFAFVQEFIDHHMASKIKSWLFEPSEVDDLGPLDDYEEDEYGEYEDGD